MARYNREFLVPYLHNICALHLTIEKINEKINALNREIRKLEEGQNVPIPRRPEEPSTFDGGGCCCIVLGLVFAFCCVFGFAVSFIEDVGFDFGLTIFYLICGAIAIFFFTAVITGYKNDRENYKKACARFESDKKRQREVEAKNQRWKDRIPAVTEERNLWRRERGRVERLLQQAYAVNIIPNYYRDIYPAVYLYDWFRSAQEDDVAVALNMFVLEEIKAKLDRIIDNQSEIILNQYIEEANRRRAMEQRNDHQRQLMSKLDRISAQSDERNNYLRMIASTSAADAYFSAANYLRNL